MVQHTCWEGWEATERETEREREKREKESE
jgi:hypothetical protein